VSIGARSIGFEAAISIQQAYGDEVFAFSEETGTPSAMQPISTFADARALERALCPSHET
jgi:hypothetical protein